MPWNAFSVIPADKPTATSQFGILLTFRSKNADNALTAMITVSVKFKCLKRYY